MSMETYIGCVLCGLQIGECKTKLCSTDRNGPLLYDGFKKDTRHLWDQMKTVNWPETRLHKQYYALFGRGSVDDRG